MATHFEKLTELLLRRAIIYPDSEIHGSMAGFYDYGSVGAEIKRRVEDYWRKYFLSLDENFHEIQTSLIMPENVFKASGHIEHFSDPVAECSKCGTSVRADHLLEDVLKESFEGLSVKEMNELIKKHKIVCTKCKQPFKDIEAFMLMFALDVGAGEAKNTAYLRPETAQGPYVAFKREFRANRQKIPLGLALVGKAFRNEISPRQMTLRGREFTQAELQIFFDPDKMDEWEAYDDVKDKNVTVKRPGLEENVEMKIRELGLPKMYAYFLAKYQEFGESLGLKDKFRLRELSAEERAFYNRIHYDFEVFMPSFEKYVEVAGLHYRGDHDLGGHAKVSGENLEVTVDGKKFLPHVLEISWGIDRLAFALIDNSYTEKDSIEYLALPRKVAPWDCAVLPLVNKDKVPETARRVFDSLREFKCFYDSSGSIGRRYARADEIGIPIAITIDFDTLADGTVTIRDRDTTKQERVKIEKLLETLKSLLR